MYCSRRLTDAELKLLPALRIRGIGHNVSDQQMIFDRVLYYHELGFQLEQINGWIQRDPDFLTRKRHEKNDIRQLLEFGFTLDQLSWRSTLKACKRV